MNKIVLIAKSIFLLAGFVATIVLLISLILFVCGDARLEWVDADGQGNGFVHEICDDNGWPIAYFRLSDYSSTNKAYSLKIRYAGLYDVSKTVAVTVCNVDGVSVAKRCFNIKTSNSDRFEAIVVDLPVAFTPDIAGETLILEFSAVTEDGDVKKKQIEFKSKKVRHQLSI